MAPETERVLKSTFCDLNYAFHPLLIMISKLNSFRSGPSIRRVNLKRAMSRESEQQHYHPEPSTSNQDSGVVTDPIVRGTKASS